MNFVRRTPPWLLLWLNRLLTLPVVFTYKALNTPLGLLTVSVLAYLWCWNNLAVKPLTPGELVLWFSNLEVEAQTGIATALITVIGFVIAFQTSNAAWIRQTRISVQLSISDEIEIFFQDVADSVIDAEIWVESFVDAVVLLRDKQGDPRIAMDRLKRLLDEKQTFLEARRNIVRRSRDVHRILGKHMLFLVQFPGATQSIDDCAEALGEIAHASWLQVPEELPVNWTAVDPNLYINIPKWSEFVSVCDYNFNRIGGLAGGVRGQLRRPLVDVGFALFSTLERLLKEPSVDQAFGTINKRRNTIKERDSDRIG